MRPPGSGKFHRAPHQVVRYAPILELLRRLRPGGRVLEVGSGSEGVGTWWTRPFVGVDLEFTQRIARPLRPVRADAVRLPFRSRVFDVVLCIAVLPWLQGPMDGALEELARVSRGTVAVVTPCGPEGDESDERKIAWCRDHGIEAPVWLLDQHRDGLPQPEAIRASLGRHGPVREAAVLSVPWAERLFRMEQRLHRIPGAGTAMQPILKGWGKLGPSPLVNGGPPYERSFVLEIDPTVSPPLTDS